MNWEAQFRHFTAVRQWFNAGLITNLEVHQLAQSIQKTAQVLFDMSSRGDAYEIKARQIQNLRIELTRLADGLETTCFSATPA